MELKKQLLEWYNSQLQEKNLFITSVQELASGYIFIEVLHNFHPKTVDLSKVYVKPKNEYEILQNYKHLVNCFSKIGWKKFDPQRYAKKRERDYLSLAQTLKKILSSRSIRESRLQSNLDMTLEEFKNEDEVKEEKKGLNQGINLKIAKLQRTKKQLLCKISKIQQAMWSQILGEDQVKAAELKERIRDILNNKIPT